MELERLDALVAELQRWTWWPAVLDLAGSLRTSAERTGDLLVLGTPGDSAQHLVAHLADAASASAGRLPTPTLVRQRTSAVLPAPRSVGLERLADVRRSTVLVVAPETVPAGVVQQVSGARNRGATVLVLGAADAALAPLAHESVVLPPAEPVQLDLAAHVLTAAVLAPGLARSA